MVSKYAVGEVRCARGSRLEWSEEEQAYICPKCEAGTHTKPKKIGG